MLKTDFQGHCLLLTITNIYDNGRSSWQISNKFALLLAFISHIFPWMCTHSMATIQFSLELSGVCDQCDGDILLGK